MGDVSVFLEKQELSSIGAAAFRRHHDGDTLTRHGSKVFDITAPDRASWARKGGYGVVRLRREEPVVVVCVEPVVAIYVCF